ncbi:hypothetical protein [Streptococcus suis]|uniref:hypothetical protein n=1 Tax=Streptococcus suis TaxID=1307 RepID=UPI00211D2625|nr:hypothetical protein [Streptococcus suis]UUM58287.1 hypothetical protein NQZ91_02630 [Streptococcus suis]
MAKENPLLKKDIESRIQNARYVEPKKEKKRKPLVYIILIIIMTLAVLFSLLGQLQFLFQ